MKSQIRAFPDFRLSFSADITREKLLKDLAGKRVLLEADVKETIANRSSFMFLQKAEKATIVFVTPTVFLIFYFSSLSWKSVLESS